MIDPTDVIKYDRTTAQLEEWWLFSCVVAGKTARTQARLLDKFLIALGCPTYSPFEAVRRAIEAGTLLERLQEARLGQYRRLERCFKESLSLDLHNDPVEAFEAVHGVGPKTARMFLMHSRPNQRLAALDTHVLKFLKSKGHVVPGATPTGRKYQELEQVFLAHADEAGQTPADFDLMIWRRYAA